MGFLSRLLLGDGTLPTGLEAELEAEGRVLVAENLTGSVRYRHFRAPGRRFHGKVTAERIGLGVSEKRVVAYCRSGRGKLVDSEFTSPHAQMADIAADGDRLDIVVDYDRGDVPNVSGQVTIRMRTPDAPAIARELNERFGRG